METPTIDSERLVRHDIDVVVASRCDLPKLKPAFSILDELCVTYEVTLLSAGRTPDLIAEFAKSASQRKVFAIIVAAGAAGHAVPAIAAQTTIPVIGIPLSTQPWGGSDALTGMTSLPYGNPCVAVGVDASANAALFAAQLVGLVRPDLPDRINAMRRSWADTYRQQTSQLRQKGLYTVIDDVVREYATIKAST
jgi:5-(carboxyamino)imidazole ribonucleotide mutase